LSGAAASSYAALEREGFFLPVVDARCRYRAPARFDDLLTIETAVREQSRATLTFGYRILRGAALLAEGSTVHACMTTAGKPARLPARLTALLPNPGPPDQKL
jgi:acyl-CoA thioester hydrolase